MDSVLRKITSWVTFIVTIMLTANVMAQTGLSDNPWAQTQGKYKVAEAPTINGLPANPWQGSGQANSGGRRQYYRQQQGLPVYTGQSTTWNTAMGQDSIAPEVNIHNMLSMTNHLRSLGYQIPPSFDNFIKTAPAKTKAKIMQALYEVRKGGGDPLSNVLATAIKDAEKASGFSTENLLGNSLDLLSTK